MDDGRKTRGETPVKNDYETNVTNPAMLMSNISQYTIQNRNVHISVLNGVLWDMRQVHCGLDECLYSSPQQ